MASTIRIDRSHNLPAAQVIALVQQWATEAEQEWGLQCHLATPQPPLLHLMTFERPGFQGQVATTADQLTMDAQLGFLFSAFADKIRQKIERRLDQALADAQASAFQPPAPAVDGSGTAAGTGADK